MPQTPKPKYKVSKKMRDILIIHQSIIENLKSQKARADRTLDKWQNLVRDEANLPSNRFLNWTRVVDPYTEAVISAKVNDYELLKRYEGFVKEIVAFEQSQLLDEVALEEARDTADKIIDKIMNLEKAVFNLKSRDSNLLKRMQENSVRNYQSSHHRTNDKRLCKACGVELIPTDPYQDGICEGCTIFTEEELDHLILPLNSMPQAMVSKSETSQNKVSMMVSKNGNRVGNHEKVVTESETSQPVGNKGAAKRGYVEDSGADDEEADDDGDLEEGDEDADPIEGEADSKESDDDDSKPEPEPELKARVPLQKRYAMPALNNLVVEQRMIVLSLMKKEVPASIAEIAHDINLNQTFVWREVVNLEDMEIVSRTRDGKVLLHEKVRGMLSADQNF